jgi:hypothetical protein
MKNDWCHLSAICAVVAGNRCCTLTPSEQLDERKEIPHEGVAVAAEAVNFSKVGLSPGPITASFSYRGYLIQGSWNLLPPPPPKE